MSLPATTWQTVGPYFRIGFSPLYRSELASPQSVGEHITLQGRVLDGMGHPVPDAVLEIWQADVHGNYSQSNAPDRNLAANVFFGFGRIATDVGGSFHFSTIKPGRVPGPDGTKQAPHIMVSLFMRGLLIRLVTRIYFLNEPSNSQDPVLKLVEPPRQSTLMAVPVDGNPHLLQWNVVLQGEYETVFFDF
jgi:protocatechuate 3,4-dioxygenase alpha subunit